MRVPGCPRREPSSVVTRSVGAVSEGCPSPGTRTSRERQVWHPHAAAHARVGYLWPRRLNDSFSRHLLSAPHTASSRPWPVAPSSRDGARFHSQGHQPCGPRGIGWRQREHLATPSGPLDPLSAEMDSGVPVPEGLSLLCASFRLRAAVQDGSQPLTGPPLKLPGNFVRTREALSPRASYSAVKRGCCWLMSESKPGKTRADSQDTRGGGARRCRFPVVPGRPQQPWEPGLVEVEGGGQRELECGAGAPRGRGRSASAPQACSLTRASSFGSRACRRPRWAGRLDCASQGLPGSRQNTG